MIKARRYRKDDIAPLPRSQSAFEITEIHEGKTLVQMLKERGFDLSTLKFTIERSA